MFTSILNADAADIEVRFPQCFGVRVQWYELVRRADRRQGAHRDRDTAHFHKIWQYSMHQDFGKDQRVLMRGRVDGIGDGSESDGDRESGDNEKEAAAKDGASTAVEGLIVCGYCDGSYTVRIEACLHSHWQPYGLISEFVFRGAAKYTDFIEKTLHFSNACRCL